MKTKNHARATDKKGFSIALPVTLIAEIQKIASGERRSRNNQIELLLEEAVRIWNAERRNAENAQSKRLDSLGQKAPITQRKV